MARLSDLDLTFDSGDRNKSTAGIVALIARAHNRPHTPRIDFPKRLGQPIAHSTQPTLQGPPICGV